MQSQNANNELARISGQWDFSNTGREDISDDNGHECLLVSDRNFSITVDPILPGASDAHTTIDYSANHYCSPSGFSYGTSQYRYEGRITFLRRNDPFSEYTLNARLLYCNGFCRHLQAGQQLSKRLSFGNDGQMHISNN
jgi:hypothetical protein